MDKLYIALITECNHLGPTFQCNTVLQITVLSVCITKKRHLRADNVITKFKVILGAKSGLKLVHDVINTRVTFPSDANVIHNVWLCRQLF